MVVTFYEVIGGLERIFLVSSECMYGSSATLVKVCLGILEWDAGCHQY